MFLISHTNPNISINLDEAFTEFCQERLYKNEEHCIPLITINNQFRRWIHFTKVFPSKLPLNVSQSWNNKEMINFFENKLETKLIDKLPKFGISGFNGYNLYNDAGKLVKPRINKIEVMTMIQNDLGKQKVCVWNKEFRKRTGLKRGIPHYQCLGLWKKNSSKK